MHSAMRTINPKCTNKNSFKYSILIIGARIILIIEQ